MTLAVKSDRRSVVIAGDYWQRGSDGPENQPRHARFNNRSASPIPKNTRFRPETKYTYRFHRSPHLPHGWDAGVLFEETRKTLFCSDLFHHFGDVAPVTSSDLIEPARKAMQQMQQGPLAGYIPYTRQTEGVLRSLADLKPETLAVMHGSSYTGPGAQLLTGLAGVIKENFD